MNTKIFNKQPGNPHPKVQVVLIKRCARAVKGGRRFSYSALVVIGDSCGRVGFGLGKSGEVASALLKAEESAAAEMVDVSLKGGTIPHEVWGCFCGARVSLRPASPGTGLIASSTVRAVLECAGVKDSLSKSLGAQNPANVVKATLQALRSLRLSNRIYEDRGLKIKKAKGPVILKFPDFGGAKNGLELN
jgi:small subunit ribosomal protein S5